MLQAQEIPDLLCVGSFVNIGGHYWFTSQGLLKILELQFGVEIFRGYPEDNGATALWSFSWSGQSSGTYSALVLVDPEKRLRRGDEVAVLLTVRPAVMELFKHFLSTNILPELLLEEGEDV